MIQALHLVTRVQGTTGTVPDERRGIMNMDNPLVQRIMRGVALLDEHEPRWWDRIDLPTFHLPSMNQCILGQLYGSYDDGLNELGLPFGTGYGFNEPICYVQGQKLWVELIQERREAAVKQ